MALKVLQTLLQVGYFYPNKWKLEYVELKLKIILKEVGHFEHKYYICSFIKLLLKVIPGNNLICSSFESFADTCGQSEEPRELGVL